MESLEVAAVDVLCGKGYELVLFLFSDILLVAKRKTGKIGGLMRSPSAASLAASQAAIQTKVHTQLLATLTVDLLHSFHLNLKFLICFLVKSKELIKSCKNGEHCNSVNVGIEIFARVTITESSTSIAIVN